MQKEDKMDHKKYIIETLEKLVNIPSPSGFTKELMQFVEQETKSFGYECEYIRKGGLLIHVPGECSETVGLSAHGDTLGAMVRSITSQGAIKFISVGGYTMNSIEGEYCKIHTREGKTYTGTILSTSPSVHTFDDARTIERKEKNMEVRLDELVKSKEEVLALGINPGDYISFDARFEYTASGFIKSRHLDDKASVAVLLGLLKDMSEQKLLPAKTVKILISNLEEIGLGATYLPADIQEFIAVDMGALGDDLSGSEYAVSICALDSSGPYDYDLTTKLINLAKEHQISYAVDIFPHYGSDASAAMRGGNNIRTALIGQGIHASHGMERTHDSALMATLMLLQAYIKSL